LLEIDQPRYAVRGLRRVRRREGVSLRILVTGATGFVGGNVARALAARGDSLVILARNVDKAKQLFPQATIAQGELGELGQMAAQLCRQLDGIVHCAAHVAPVGRWVDFEKMNVIGTQQLLTAALEGGVKRFVNLSSPSVYADFTARTNIKESDPLPKKQVSMYGQSKVLADELIAKAANQGLNICSLRPRGVIGVGDQNIIPRLLKTASAGVLPMIDGGRALVDMTAIDNLVTAALMALDNAEQFRGEVFNISNGEPMPAKAFAKLVFDAFKKDVKFINLPWPLARTLARTVEQIYAVLKPNVEPPVSVYSLGIAAFDQTLDITKAKEKLKYQPIVSISSAISQCAATP
jgi:nucleoside-diphosphate-sugar epimerase